MSVSTLIERFLPLWIEPKTQLTLAALGCRYHIETQHGKTTVLIHIGMPVGFFDEQLDTVLQQALRTEFPTQDITLEIVYFVEAHRTQLLGKGLRGVKNTLAVASGKGGVGKSSVAVNLAVALAKAGAKVGLLDADIYGPSIPMMLGQTAPVQMQESYYLPVKAHGIEAMSIGYLTQNEDALIWRGPMLAKSLIQMLDMTLWQDLDYLIIDLPPGTGDIQLSLVQKIPLSAAIVVTTPQNIATLDAQKALKMFVRTGIDVLGLVENMALHTCSACHHQEAIFGEGGAQALSQKFELPLLGQLPLNGQIRVLADQGVPAALAPETSLSRAWYDLAQQTALALAKKPLNFEPAP